MSCMLVLIDHSSYTPISLFQAIVITSLFGSSLLCCLLLSLASALEVQCLSRDVYQSDGGDKLPTTALACAVLRITDAFLCQELLKYSFVVGIDAYRTAVAMGMYILYLASVPGLPRYAVLLASVNCARAGHTEFPALAQPHN